MDDLIYKISEVFLYDNQLKNDYIILYNRRKSFFSDCYFDEIPYKYSNSLNEIYGLNRYENFKKRSIEIMKKVKVENTLFIKNDGFLILEKIENIKILEQI